MLNVVLHNSNAKTMPLVKRTYNTDMKVNRGSILPRLRESREDEILHHG